MTVLGHCFLVLSLPTLVYLAKFECPPVSPLVQSNDRDPATPRCTFPAAMYSLIGIGRTLK